MDDIIKRWIEGIFGNIDWQQSEIIKNVTMSPATAFGEDFWNTLLKIGTCVVMPFAITILCYFMAAELYTVYCKANGGLDLQLVSTTMVKFILPFVFITKTYDLLQLIFNMFNKMILQIGLSVNTVSVGNTVDTNAWYQQISSMNTIDKLGYWLQLMPLWMFMKAMSLVIMVIVYGRLFEIVLYWIFAPIPFATLVHSEFSQIGKNFIKMFCAILLQGGFMILCVVLYTILIKQAAFEPTMNGAWMILGYSAILVFTLTKTGSLSKRLFGTF